MKAHPLMLRGLIVLALIVIVPIGVGIALAHGTPTIAVEATIVAAGSPISITGSGMAAGESFTITLDGMAGSIELGTVTATSEGQAGGFTVTYTVPANSTPGSYTVPPWPKTAMVPRLTCRLRRPWTRRIRVRRWPKSLRRPRL
jgi:hypothetical protein